VSARGSAVAEIGEQAGRAPEITSSFEVIGEAGKREAMDLTVRRGGCNASKVGNFPEKAGGNNIYFLRSISGHHNGYQGRRRKGGGGRQWGRGTTEGWAMVRICYGKYQEIYGWTGSALRKEQKNTYLRSKGGVLLVGRRSRKEQGLGKCK